MLVIQSKCKTVMKALRNRVVAKRAGNVAAMVAVILPVILTVSVMFIEIARMRHTKNQLQAAADAGALAGAAQLRVGLGNLESFGYSLPIDRVDGVRPAVISVVEQNEAVHLRPDKGTPLRVSANESNDVDGDIVIGNYANGQLSSSWTQANAVRVTVRFQDQHLNGRFPMLFGKAVPFQPKQLSATASAFTEHPALLPFVIWQPQWEALVGGLGGDSLTVDPHSDSVTDGSDGIPEMSVFPNSWPGLEMPPGSFGWIQLGPSSNANVIRRQIAFGPDVHDMAYYGGSLEAGTFVSAQPGLIASANAPLQGGKGGGYTFPGIIGQPRMAALYDYVDGNGANARYRISKFVMLRIVDADLSGNNKRIVVQPLVGSSEPFLVRLVQ